MSFLKNNSFRITMFFVYATLNLTFLLNFYSAIPHFGYQKVAAVIYFLRRGRALVFCYKTVFSGARTMPNLVLRYDLEWRSMRLSFFEMRFYQKGSCLLTFLKTGAHLAARKKPIVSDVVNKRGEIW